MARSSCGKRSDGAGRFMNATIKLPRPLSVNSLFANVPKKGRVKSQRYRTWIQNAVQVAKGIADGKARPLPKFDGPVKINFFVPEKGVKMDIDNAAKAYIDLLVSLEIIPDDSPKYVRGISLDWVDAETGEAVIIEAPTQANI